MNDILNELLTEILLLGEADKKDTGNKEPRATKNNRAGVPDGLYHRGRGMYFDKPTGGTYMGKVVYSGTGDKVGKWVAKANAPTTEPKTADGTDGSTETPDANVGTPTRMGGNGTTELPPIPREKYIEILDRQINRRQSISRKTIRVAMRAALSGDTALLQRLVGGVIINPDGTLVDDPSGNSALVISPRGKIKTVSGLKLAADDKEMAKELQAVSRQVGIDIPVLEKEADVGISDFKPTVLFAKMKQDQLSVDVLEGDPNRPETITRIKIEGRELKVATENEISQAEETLVERAKAFKEAQGQEFTKEYEEKVRRYARGVYEKSNHNIRHLVELYNKAQQSKSKKLATYEFEGTSGKKALVSALKETIAKYVPDKKQQRNIFKALDAMARAKTANEFNAAYIAFSLSIADTSISTSKKYIAESLTALSVVCLGGRALIPDRDAFPLADVISLRENPLSGDFEIEQILSDVEQEQTLSIAKSAKAGKGNASGNYEKVKNSKFKTGEVDGVDCTHVQRDLLEMTAPTMKNAIFQPTEDGATPQEIRDKLLTYIRTYKPMISIYYGLDANMSDEEVYDFLSYGRELACVDGQVRPTDNGVPYNQATRANGGQWRAWSVLGKITDAIHNRTVEYQFYDTMKFNGRIVLADGIRTLSKMKSQHYKGEDPMSGAEGRGFTVPNISLNAFTVPSSLNPTPDPESGLEYLRSGNPCGPQGR